MTQILGYKFCVKILIDEKILLGNLNYFSDPIEVVEDSTLINNDIDRANSLHP